LSGRLHLDLGRVHDLAQVRLNGRDLGVIWTAPWRADITGILRAKDNVLEIDVVNLWPNRLVGDAKLPRERRRTSTNVWTYEDILPDNIALISFGCLNCTRRAKTGEPAALLPSGLIGPVTLVQDQADQVTRVTE
jgi:hypothetical protein